LSGNQEGLFGGGDEAIIPVDGIIMFLEELWISNMRFISHLSPVSEVRLSRVSDILRLIGCGWQQIHQRDFLIGPLSALEIWH
jgi:hypothetical protein